MRRIDFSPTEKNAILHWYENISEDKMHFGQSRYYLPSEESLVTKLKAKETNIVINDNELRMIYGWMEKSLISNFGSSIVFLPGEESVFNKIKFLIKRIEKEDRKKYKTSGRKRLRILKRFNKEKEAEEESERIAELERIEIENIRKKLEEASKKIIEINKEKEYKKNRSIDDKIAATNKLKADLDEIRKQLNF